MEMEMEATRFHGTQMRDLAHQHDDDDDDVDVDDDDGTEMTETKRLAAER